MFDSLDNCPYCGTTLVGFACISCRVEFVMRDDQLVEDFPRSASGASGANCEACQASLATADRYLPYEDGSNADAFARCPSCGHASIRHGFGEDLG